MEWARYGSILYEHPATGALALIALISGTGLAAATAALAVRQQRKREPFLGMGRMQGAMAGFVLVGAAAAVWIVSAYRHQLLGAIRVHDASGPEQVRASLLGQFASIELAVLLVGATLALAIVGTVADLLAQPSAVRRAALARSLGTVVASGLGLATLVQAGRYVDWLSSPLSSTGRVNPYDWHVFIEDAGSLLDTAWPVVAGAGLCALLVVVLRASHRSPASASWGAVVASAALLVLGVVAFVATREQAYDARHVARLGPGDHLVSDLAPLELTRCADQVLETVIPLLILPDGFDLNGARFNDESEVGLRLDALRERREQLMERPSVVLMLAVNAESDTPIRRLVPVFEQLRGRSRWRAALATSGKTRVQSRTLGPWTLERVACLAPIGFSEAGADLGGMKTVGELAWALSQGQVSIRW